MADHRGRCGRMGSGLGAPKGGRPRAAAWNAKWPGGPQLCLWVAQHIEAKTEMPTNVTDEKTAGWPKCGPSQAGVWASGLPGQGPLASTLF